MLMVRDTNTCTGTHMYMDKARVSQDICMGWPIRVWAKYLHAGLGEAPFGKSGQQQCK